jgi:hypothetical protein
METCHESLAIVDDARRVADAVAAPQGGGEGRVGRGEAAAGGAMSLFLFGAANRIIEPPPDPPPGSITLDVAPTSGSVTQGSTTDYTATLARTNYTDTVTLVTTGLPTGVTASYPNGDTFTGAQTTRTLRLTAAGNAPVVTNDSFTVTASGSGVTDATDTATITVVAASTDWPNEPAGFTNLVPGTADWETSSVGAWVGGTRDGWGQKFLNDQRSVAIATVSGTPSGGTRAVQYIYPPNHIGGGGVEIFVDIPTSPTKYGKIYLGMDVRASANWYGHPSFVAKWCYFRQNDGLFWTRLMGGANGPLYLDMVSQINAPSRAWGDTSVLFVRNTWHRVEVLYELAPIGRARLWQDGVLLANATNVEGSNYPDVAWLTGVTLSGILGGNGDTQNPSEQYLEYDRVRISVST